MAFDPATGEAVGEPMSVPGWRVDEVLSASATPDESRVAFTWCDEERSVDETAVFDVRSGELLVRGLPGVDSTLVIGPNELIAVTERDGCSASRSTPSSRGRASPARRGAARRWT